MKSKLLFIHLLLVSVIFSSCGGISSKTEVTHIPIRMKEDGNWSLLDIKTGKVLYEGEFKNSPSIATDGIFITENDNGKLFFNRIEDDKKFVQIAGPYKTAYPFTEGIAIVCKEDDYISAINTKGEELFKLKPEKDIEFTRVGQCYDGMIIFEDQNGYYGYLNKSGKVAIKPQYDFADDFRNGRARVSKNKDNKDIIQIIDNKGVELMKPDYAYIGPVQGDMVAYSNSKDEFGVLKVGKEKEKMIAASGKFEQLLINNDVIYFSSDEEWGTVSEKGEIKIRAKYSSLSKLDKSTFLGVKVDGKDKKFEILNEDGDVIISQDVDEAFSLGNGNFFIKDGKNIELRNSKGEALGNVAFKSGNDIESAIRVMTGESHFIESQYFDWNKITNTLKELKANSVMGVGINENCIQVEKKLVSLGNQQNGSEKNERSKGLANYSKRIRMRDHLVQRFIGSGYESKSDISVSDEGDDTELAPEAPAIEDAPYTDYDSRNNTAGSNVNIDDKAPDWTSYQMELSKQIDLGKAGNMTVEFKFDDYIKKPVKKTVLETYYGYDYYTEKTVGYVKNDKSVIDKISIRFYIYDESKTKKLGELLKEHFKDKEFTLVFSNNENSRYEDINKNVWEVKDNQIRFYINSRNRENSESENTSAEAIPATSAY